MAVYFHEEDLPGDVFAPGAPLAVDTETMGLITPRDRLCLVQISDGLGDEQKGDLQEAQLHASDMLNVVPENTSLVGGRAESAAEFLQQMKERDNAGMGPKLSWG